MGTIIVGLAGCSGGGTVTVDKTSVPPASEPPTNTATAVLRTHHPSAHHLNNPAQQPDPSVTVYCNEVPEGHPCHAVTATPSDPNSSPQRNCDTNIVANSATSCALAENTFYEVYASRNLQEKYRAVMVHSPATNKDYELDCNNSGSLIACTSSPLSQDIYVSFPQAAIAAYTESQASAYVSKRDVGQPGVTAARRTEENEVRLRSVPKPESGGGKEGGSSEGEDEVGSYNHASDQSFCNSHECIGSFTTEGGTIVKCSDGSYSHAGGIPGACSHHGGEAEG
jgi:hypothetical protein